MNPLDLIEAAHAMAGFAGTIRTYYVALIEQGFTEDEAMALTVSWQSSLILSGGQS